MQYTSTWSSFRENKDSTYTRWLNGTFTKYKELVTFQLNCVAKLNVGLQF